MKSIKNVPNFGIKEWFAICVQKKQSEDNSNVKICDFWKERVLNELWCKKNGLNLASEVTSVSLLQKCHKNVFKSISLQKSSKKWVKHQRIISLESNVYLLGMITIKSIIKVSISMHIELINSISKSDSKQFSH